MATVILNVQGMECDACVGHVTRALSSLPGVSSAQVDLSAGTATVSYDPAAVSVGEMRAAVEEEGYEAS